MLVDLRNKGINGRDAETALDESGITCNKNAVPYDTESPLITSGIRLGTPAMTTRGMREEDMKVIANFIDTTISNHSDESIKSKIKSEVKEFTKSFPLHKKIKL